MKKQKSKKFRKERGPQFVGLPKYPPSNKKYYFTKQKPEIEERKDV